MAPPNGTKYIPFPLVNPLISWILINNWLILYQGGWDFIFHKDCPPAHRLNSIHCTCCFPSSWDWISTYGIKISGPTSYLVGILCPPRRDERSTVSENHVQRIGCQKSSKSLGSKYLNTFGNHHLENDDCEITTNLISY